MIQNSLSNFLALFLVCLSLSGQQTIFAPNSVPATVNDKDSQPVELGVKFRASEAGKVIGVKFYKGPQNTGVHTGSLWDASGKLLGKVQFENESASGWQTATFPSPINIAANTTYVISYFAPKGQYSISSGFFTNSEVKNGSLTALRSTSTEGNGVFQYGSSAFPKNSWFGSNYWVDVIFTANAATTPTAPATTTSLWPAPVTPKTLETETRAVELGLKFRTSTAGLIQGIRFFKTTGNGGAHVGRLWSRDGKLLASANFVNETASGWQQANFTTPVAIEANKVYIASYHAPQGRYAYDTAFFNNGFTNQTLTALQNGADGGNGVYQYGSGGVFPTGTFQSTNYWVDVAFTASATPAPIAAPQISSQPQSTTVTAGATASFSVTATGSGTLTYQWQRNGSNITGATSNSFTTSAATTMDNGAKFRVVVTSSGGSTTSNEATLTVNAAAPTITSQPQPRTVNVGEAATFSVTATGAGMLTYQWQRNGMNINGATGSTYTVASAQPGDNAAKFRVVVSSGSLNTTSNEAVLTVKSTPPTISAQPASQTVTAGAAAKFSVTATGSAPLKYEWRKNNTAISGATTDSYTTPATTMADDKSTYTVLVSNSEGAATSAAAVLTVNANGSTTSLSANPTSVKIGETVSLVAVVAQTGLSSAIPTGQVEFLNGTTVLGTVNLDASGKASLSWKAPSTPGSVTLQARYKGTATIAASSSASVAISVVGILTSGTRPPNEAEAARFLNQATFGATKADIDYLMNVGYDKWFEEQFGPDQDPTYINTLFKVWNSGIPYALAPQHKWNYTGWYSVVVPGKSQLRLRMEWALSQIFVVTENSINSRERLLYYGDILRKNAFSNYRKLLNDITYSAHMAIMLTYTPNFWNDKSTSNPDQNMARELMQLFSIGLWELNLDGSQKLKDGKPIPTYGAADIIGLSHVFTGLGTKEPRNADGSTPPDAYVNRMLNPIESYPAGYRSQIEKKFLGATIPASPAGTRLATDDIPIALDTVAKHPNVAPFLSKQLIQRFVTSNPSPEYIARVATVWNNNGSGVRGDLKAVLRAVLMDEEARNPALAYRPEAGKIREFALRLGNFYRTLNVAMPQGILFGGNNGDTQYWQKYTSEVDIQHPYYAPTVFNWYRPGFAPPGTALDEAGLLAPEMQIITTDSTLQWSNFLKDSLDRGGVGSMDYSNPTNKFQLDEWTSLAVDTKSLIDRLDLLLFAGRMSDTTRQALTKSIDAVSGNGTTAASRLNRVKVAFAIAFVAPDYIVQK